MKNLEFPWPVSCEEELENEEIIAICRKNNITISDLMAR